MDIFNILWTVLKSLLSTVKVILPMFIPVILAIIIIILLYIFNLLYLRVIRGMKRKPLVKRIEHTYPFEYKGIKYCLRYTTEDPYVYKNDNPSIFKRLFVMFPRQLAFDSMNRDCNEFQEFGINIFCGRQGSGKTMTVVYLLNLWRKKYPSLKIFTNFGYKYETEELVHWKQLVTNFNGIYGTVYGIDELHTWLSMKSNTVPFELLKEISTQRKQKSCILGTCQVFGKVPKEIREQAEWVYLPRTFFNCLTIVRKARPEEYNYDKNKFKRYYGTFFFVHDKELRESYDTFKRISRLADSDFEKNEFLSAEE